MDEVNSIADLLDLAINLQRAIDATENESDREQLVQRLAETHSSLGEQLGVLDGPVVCQALLDAPKHAMATLANLPEASKDTSVGSSSMSEPPGPSAITVAEALRPQPLQQWSQKAIIAMKSYPLR